jgi:hypothetical protein
MSSRSLVRVGHAAVAALSLTVAAAAGAQQVPAPRFVRATSTDPMAAESSIVAPRDSVARYVHTAQVQRLTGGSLIAAGLATIAGAYVQFARGGRMGMTSGQAAAFAGGAALGAVGATRWVASRESSQIAARWEREASRVAAQR